MLKEIVNRLRGQVRLRVESPFPERVLNLCGARNLAFWDLEWESATAFTCRMSRGDYRVLHQAAAQLECAVTPVKKEGVPYFLGRFRHRQALAVGLVGAACALTVGSFFIWDFTVEGNVTVTDEEILRSLADNGVGLGTFGLSLDGESIRNHVLLDIPELSWIPSMSPAAGPMSRYGSAIPSRRWWMSGAPPTWWPGGRGWCWTCRPWTG